MTDKIEVISLAIGAFSGVVSGVVVYCLARRGQPSLPKRVIPVNPAASECDSPCRAIKREAEMFPEQMGADEIQRMRGEYSNGKE